MAPTVEGLRPAERPTFYFIGVTTGQSAIMKLFPRWAERLGLSAEIIGIDMKIHDRPENYRRVAEFLKNDPLSLGGLVTTHKIDLYQACRGRGIFDFFDDYATRLEEISCISKLEGRFEGHAKDPISSGAALESFLPRGYFAAKDKEVFIMGAGGSSVSTCFFLMKRGAETGHLPRRIVVSNRSQARLDNLKKLLAPVINVDLETHWVGEDPANNDRLLASLSPGAVVINATGKGKDTPGSPLSDQAVFPEGAMVWEFNYRGELDFLRQARRQEGSRGLTIEDGWLYFIHGWTQVIFQVFHLTVEEEGFQDLVRIADSMRG